MRADPLAIGVIGAGRMGARHALTVRAIDGAELVAIADPSRLARERALSGARALETADWRDLVGAPRDLDAVIVATPSETHAEIAVAALEAGLHVLVEKPIATTVPDALRMIGAARESGRTLMVGHLERFNPAVRKVRHLVEEGRLGRIFRISARRVGPQPRRVLDVGVAIDLATHDLDVMQYVLGERIERVFADGGRFSHSRHEDLLSCVLRFSGGAHGLLDVNWVTPEKQRDLTILGEAGMVRASYLTQEVWFYETARGRTPWQEFALFQGDGDGAVVRFAVRHIEPIRAQLEAFIDCVIQRRPAPVTGEDGLLALLGALGLLESLESGQPMNPVERMEAMFPAPARGEVGA